MTKNTHLFLKMGRWHKFSKKFHQLIYFMRRTLGEVLTQYSCSNQWFNCPSCGFYSNRELLTVGRDLKCRQFQRRGTDTAGSLIVAVIIRWKHMTTVNRIWELDDKLDFKMMELGKVLSEWVEKGHSGRVWC